MRMQWHRVRKLPQMLTKEGESQQGIVGWTWRLLLTGTLHRAHALPSQIILTTEDRSPSHKVQRTVSHHLELAKLHSNKNHSSHEVGTSNPTRSPWLMWHWKKAHIERNLTNLKAPETAQAPGLQIESVSTNDGQPKLSPRICVRLIYPIEPDCFPDFSLCLCADGEQVRPITSIGWGTLAHTHCVTEITKPTSWYIVEPNLIVQC